MLVDKWKATEFMHALDWDKALSSPHEDVLFKTRTSGYFDIELQEVELGMHNMLEIKHSILI